MNETLDRFRSLCWNYAPGDAAAVAELSKRLADVGRRQGLVTYSDLVRGVTFNLANLRQPKHQIDTTDWQDLDRAILGDFLGYLSLESYERAGFFVSALAVSKQNGCPGEGFYTLLKELGLITGSKTDEAMYLWADHVAKAHAWYSEASAAARRSHRFDNETGICKACGRSVQAVTAFGWPCAEDAEDVLPSQRNADEATRAYPIGVTYYPQELLDQWIERGAAMSEDFIPLMLTNLLLDSDESRERVPYCRGLSIGTWLQHLQDADPDWRQRAKEAIATIGPVALPWVEWVLFSESTLPHARETLMEVCQSLIAPGHNLRRQMAWMLIGRMMESPRAALAMYIRAKGDRAMVALCTRDPAVFLGLVGPEGTQPSS